MNRLFIHHPVFRLIGPLCSGTLVYMLILLVNNNVAQLQEEFLGQELYVCIALSYLIQEYSRISLFFFEKLRSPKSLVGKIMLQVVISIMITIILVTVSMFLYFDLVLGFTPNVSELIIFNSIFSLITIIYLSLYLSHQFLHKINTEIITQELSKKQGVEKDFIQFKKGINPILMYETLEALILLMKKDKEKAELLVDHFSAVYRYILAETSKELVSLSRELEVLDQLLLLFGHLPYRKTSCLNKETITTWVVPGSILSFVEQIIRSTIVSKDEELIITILENSQYILLKYPHQEKIIETMDHSAIKDIQDAYRYYSDLETSITVDDAFKIIQIPKLTVDESSYS
ncbi:histidine kinase [Aquimarina gracilis]|uniref:Histidine kinase n=1 Tax=Aquimarina gracilis TaxID=874422 RepID=A0ABU5ZQ08_9FLAO|nr:histidine kinase [Aquimarina gracilis]MEB3344172.1 histidine kinase [Aquimarina gracilis]